LFQTQQEVLVWASSGTGAMEAAVTNLLSPGDKALCIRGGKFGERWAEICSAYGVVPVNLDVPWGKAVNPADVDAILAKDKDIKIVYGQATETSTGVRHPVKELAEVAHKHDRLVVIDGITGVGVFDIKVDEWGLDGLVTGSQKALMLPPGLAFCAFSERALKAAASSKCPKFYFNVLKELKKLKENTTLFTPAVSLMVGLKESLAMMKEEGLQTIFARHAWLAKATQAAVLAIGMKLYAADSPSPALTAALSAPLDGQKVLKVMRDSYGVTIAGGQDEAKGKIFRVSHMGYVDEWNVMLTVAALEKACLELGHKFTMGDGMKAALEVVNKKPF
jgi:aspartate aminotransferase-like enzyme